jgi:hypothetical protein
MFVSIQPKPGKVRKGIIVQPSLLNLTRRCDQVRERSAVSNRYDYLRLVTNEDVAELGIRRITSAVQSLLFIIFVYGSRQIQAIVTKNTYDGEFLAL